MSAATRGLNRYRRDRDAYVANFQRRVIMETLTDASVWYWRRRAETFDAVGTPRCAEVALACRQKAFLLEKYGLDQDELLADLWAIAAFGITGDEKVA